MTDSRPHNEFHQLPWHPLMHPLFIPWTWACPVAYALSNCIFMPQTLLVGLAGRLEGTLQTWERRVSIISQFIGLFYFFFLLFWWLSPPDVCCWHFASLPIWTNRFPFKGGERISSPGLQQVTLFSSFKTAVMSQQLHLIFSQFSILAKYFLRTVP